MPAKRKAASLKDASTATIGFEAKLWLAADKLRNNMDAAEPSRARQTAEGSPEGERRGADPCGRRFARRKRASPKEIVQSEKFLKSHGGKLGDISIFDQESNATTRRLAIMNLVAISGTESDISKEHADTCHHVQHPDVRADYVLPTRQTTTPTGSARTTTGARSMVSHPRAPGPILACKISTRPIAS